MHTNINYRQQAYMWQVKFFWEMSVLSLNTHSFKSCKWNFTFLFTKNGKLTNYTFSPFRRYDIGKKIKSIKPEETCNLNGSLISHVPYFKSSLKSQKCDIYMTYNKPWFFFFCIIERKSLILLAHKKFQPYDMP